MLRSECPYSSTNMRIDSALEKLKQGENLTRTEARKVMEDLLSGGVPDETIAALLVALRDKGEILDEVVGFAEIMRARAAEALAAAGVKIESMEAAGALLDTCGTGGDGKGTFNVSTAAALVAAAAGARVAKHGNRSISSRCGSADVLEALGVAIEIPLRRIPECLERAGMVFLYAPQLHSATKHVMNARRSLAGKTVFNLLGPLTNPLGANVQLAGVYDPRRTEMMALSLAAFGSRRAFVVTSHDGMDEISIAGLTQISEACEGRLATRHLVPEEFGLAQRAPAGAWAGGDRETNARIITEVLHRACGPYRDMVLVNASAALVVAGVAADFLAGMDMARRAIDSGAARQKLTSLKEFTQKYRL
ncbi:MAG TPA: anthranilate phosphoribosyltransferase [Terriglobia bacterium]|nr:anthranilate phosphoribosyltransferase [Terriglobia bacterium]